MVNFTFSSRSDVSGSCASGSEAAARDCWMLSRQSSALLSDGSPARWSLGLHGRSSSVGSRVAAVHWDASRHGGSARFGARRQGRCSAVSEV